MCSLLRRDCLQESGQSGSKRQRTSRLASKSKHKLDRLNFLFEAIEADKASDSETASGTDITDSRGAALDTAQAISLQPSLACQPDVMQLPEAHIPGAQWHATHGQSCSLTANCGITITCTGCIHARLSCINKSFHGVWNAFTHTAYMLASVHLFTSRPKLAYTHCYPFLVTHHGSWFHKVLLQCCFVLPLMFL